MRRWIAALALTASASHLTAQPPPTFREEVVVTATLTGEEDREGLAATAYVVGRETLEERQATTVAELLATLPGAQVVRSGSPGQPTSLFIRGAASNQVLVLWNGIPLNNPFFGGFNWAFLPTEGVERVELVPGPLSALYGSSAAGGVVQVLTDRDPGWRLQLEGGDRGYRRGALSAAHRVGIFHGELSGHSRRGDGERPNDDFASDELAMRVAAEGEGGHVGLQARWNDSASGIPMVGETPSLQRRIGWRERELGLPLQWSGHHWQAQGLVSQVHYESAFRDPEDPFGFTWADTESRADRGRATATWRPGGAWRWSVGSEVERLTASDRSSFGVNLQGARQRTWALFTELSLEGDRWAAQVGARRDDNDVYGSQTSPRAGLVVALTPQLRLRGSYGRGFRAPSLGELFFPFFGNPELQPERSTGWELGLEHRRGPWRWQITGFETRLRDLVDFDESFRSVNIGRARNRGVEASAGFEAPQLSARLAATWLDARDLDRELSLRRRARESASLSLTWRPGSWTTNLLAVYVGERPDTDPITGGLATNPSHLRLNLALRWQIRPRVAPYARVENMTNTSYAEALGFPAPGRTLIGGLALSR